MRTRWVRTEHGAAAVEATLISSVILVPLVLGVLVYGNWFWQAQKVDPLASRLPVDGIVGTFSCDELVNQVRTTVTNALNANSLGVSVPAESVLVEVVRVLPTVGADVQVSIDVPAADQLGGLVPLPDGGNLVSEATFRLNNVVVTTSSCR